jgi:asparagine synthase (glutamine-hydrolysing)
MCGFTYRHSSTLGGTHGYLRHRGPDEQSYTTADNYELEFSRLTITGTTEGQVPVYSENGKWLVAFNGEIYNFKQLIESYQLPRTSSDTKVIANGLEKYGLDFLKQLRGMFAGVVIDLGTNTKYIFRDPLGEKPLFYFRDDDQFVVASEFTALLRMLNRPLKLNPKAVTDYFRFGYVQEPETFDADIFAIKPGAIIELREGNLFAEVGSLEGYNDDELGVDLPDLLEVLNSEVSFSTVPTGLALSAGVDSTSLLYAMSKYRDSDFLPLIVNISSTHLSQEALEAQEACKKLGIKPHLINDLGSSDLEARLLSLAGKNDQPHADPSGLSYLSIFEEAKSIGLKVILLGHGPDELFWGYPWFNKQLIRARQKTFFRKVNPPAYWDTPGKNSRLLWSFGCGEKEEGRGFATDSYLTSSNPWERYRAEIVHGYLSPNGLRQSDRLAMASGIEPRTPYADSRLYGWAQRNSIKSDFAFDKKEFRDSVQLGPLGSSRYRKKEGFSSPMGMWFQNPAINEFTSQCLKIVMAQNLDWRFSPRLQLLSPSEKYRIVMLGAWLSQISEALTNKPRSI